MLKFLKLTTAKYVWEVHNDKDEFLGCIGRKRVGRFMHFVFEPAEETYFTNGCLKEIRSFITKCYGEQKNDKGN